MTHVACESMLRSVGRSETYVHLCPGKWVAIRHVVVYYARSADAFSARKKCRHCSFKAGTPLTNTSDIVMTYPIRYGPHSGQVPFRPVTNPNDALSSNQKCLL